MAPQRAGPYADLMPYMTSSDATTRRPRGPEEIVLDGWLEDAGPYVKLELQGPKWKSGVKFVEPGRNRDHDAGAA